MQQGRFNSFAKIAIFLFAFLCIVTVFKIRFDINQLAERKSVLEAKIALKEEKIGELEHRYNTPYDDDYIADLAEEKLNLVKPDDVIFYNDLTK